MRVVIESDYQALSRTAAGVVIEAVRAKPALTLALPTGGTPLGMYAEIVKRFRAESLDFSQVATFNLDEYFGIPQDHPRSYHTYMREHFFNHTNVPPANIHIPDGTPGIDGDRESERYEKAIAEAGGIDLLVAGIGGNGHIAFNEPGSSFDSKTRVVNLTPETLAHAQHHFGAERVPSRAITMGIANILAARRVLLLASGVSKAQIIRPALQEPVTVALPASALQLHPDVTVILDQDASSLL